MAQFVTCQRLLHYMWTVLISWNKCYHIMEKSFKINTWEVQFTCKHLLQSRLDWVNCCIGLYIFFLLIVFSVCANPLAQKHRTPRWERVNIILLCSSNRNKSIPRLSLRKWGYSVNWFIHGNMETQLWESKLHANNQNCRRMWFSEQLPSFFMLLLKKYFCMLHKANRGPYKGWIVHKGELYGMKWVIL